MDCYRIGCLCAFLAFLIGTPAAAQTTSPGEDPAFDAVREQANPLSPAQIRQLKKDTAETNRAIAWPESSPPQPRSSSERVPLKPGAPIPTVFMYGQLSTSIVFLNRAGRPWTIRSVHPIGPEGKVFNISGPDKTAAAADMKHVVILSARVPIAGLYNLSVILEGLSTPISVNLAINNAPLHDSRKDLHIQACGPAGCPSRAPAPPPAFDQAIYDLLDGIAPPNAVARRVPNAPGTQVWEADGRMFLRTQETLILPACLPGEQARRSDDGTLACITQPATSLLVSRGGVPTTLVIAE